MTQIRHKVFVYGTLKRGFRANLKLRESEFVGESVTMDRFVVRGEGFPMAFFDPEGHRLQGEVYEITDETLKELDYYEGYPHFYNRKIIEVETYGPAWMYYVSNSLAKELSTRKLPPAGNGILVWS